MAALTLIEATKLAAANGETKRAAVIATYARTSAYLAHLPFKPIKGNAYSYNQEQTLPGIAFRGVNESYTPSTGIINPQTESLRICGGDLDVDKFITDTQGPTARSTQEEMKTKALSHSMTAALIKGDSTSDPRQFDGLQNRVRIGGPQFVAPGVTQAGDPLSLYWLDYLIGITSGARKELWVNRKMANRFTQAARDKDVGGLIVVSKDDFGRPIMQYNGCDIVNAFPENDGTEPIGFDEQGGFGAVAGGSTSSSIYCVGLGDGYLSGIQNAPMRVQDLGELQTQPVERTRVEWYAGLVAEHPRCISRYAGISDAAFVK